MEFPSAYPIIIVAERSVTVSASKHSVIKAVEYLWHKMGAGWV